MFKKRVRQCTYMYIPSFVCCVTVNEGCKCIALEVSDLFLSLLWHSWLFVSEVFYCLFDSVNKWLCCDYWLQVLSWVCVCVCVGGGGFKYSVYHVVFCVDWDVHVLNTACDQGTCTCTCMITHIMFSCRMRSERWWKSFGEWCCQIGPMWWRRSMCALVIVLVPLQRQCSPIGRLLEAPMYPGGLWQCGGAK